jgi:DNA-binding LytR/AlgR family response regulator
LIKSIAIDDEPLALQVIFRYAIDVPSIKVMMGFTDAINAKTFISTHEVDLIFLDIQMPDISGIQLFESICNKPLVIFTTAFSEYAVKGFDLEAVDYLIKPIKFERFVQGVERAKKIFDQKTIRENTGTQDFFFVKSEYHFVKIAFDDILYIEGLDDYVKIHLCNSSKPILSLISRKSLMEKLPQEKFIRVHRSYIVPVRMIKFIHNRQVSLGSVKIPVGDTYISTVGAWLREHK